MGSKKTKNTPWAPAQPFIIKGMQQTSDTFDVNQPRLQDMSKQAYDAFNNISPEAFEASPFVKNAQGAAGAIGSGGLLGSNPGQSTYDRLMAGGVSRSPMGGGMMGGGLLSKRPLDGGGDPSMGLLSRMARGGNDPSMGALSAMTTPGANPGDRMASAVSGGKYLNNQPSAGLYDSMMSGDYLNGNPYLDSVIEQTNADVTKQANRMFGARGMGSGISSAFADVLSKNLADNEGRLRYQNYNDASNRQLQAAGQSDSAWSGERGRMDNATGLLSDNFNQGQSRALAAAQALGNQYSDGQDRSLAAAQALGGQYGQNQDRALAAAQAGDAAQQSQVQQMLTALGLTGELRDAEFAGIAPALGLLNTAADIPYVGTAALNGQIREASNGYGTTKTSGGLGQALLGAGAQLGSAWLGRK